MSRISELFASLSEGQTRILSELNESQHRAVIGALALAMMIDREVVQAEVDMFDAILDALPVFQKMTLEHRRALLSAALEDLGQLEDREATLVAVRSAAVLLPEPEVRELIFAMVVAITLADRVVVDLETNALGDFVGAFELDFGRALEIITETRSVLGIRESP